MSGLRFDDLAGQADERTVRGLPVRFLGAEGLIRLKKDSLRPKDQLDVQALRALPPREA